MPTKPVPQDSAEAEQNRSMWRASGLGLELAGSIAGMAALGWVIDRGAGTAPRWLLICLAIGVIGGGYNFIRRALAMNREATAAYRKSRIGKGPLPPLRDEDDRDSRESGMFQRKGADEDDDDDAESGSFGKSGRESW